MKKYLFIIPLVIVFCTGLTACGSSTVVEPPVGATTLLADNASYPAIAADAHGNIVAVWAALPDFKASFYLKGLGWTPPESIGTLAPGWSDLQVASNSRGDVVVVWLRHEGPGGVSIHTEAVRYTAAAGWEQPVNLGEFGSPKSIAINDSGEAWIVSAVPAFPFQRVGAARYVPGAGWGAAELIDDNANGRGDPQVMIDESARATVVWTEGQAPGSVMARQFLPSTGWGASQVVRSGSTESKTLAGRKNGEAVVIWSEWTGPIQNIYSAFFVPGSGWSLPARISSPVADATQPAAAADAAGNYMAVWTEITQTGGEILASRYSPGTGWSAPARIGTGGSAAKPLVGMDEVGGACAVWFQFDPAGPFPGDINPYSNRFSLGTGWELQRSMRLDVGAVDAPRLAVSSDGTAVAIWSQSNGSFGIGSPKYGVYAYRVR